MKLKSIKVFYIKALFTAILIILGLINIAPVNAQSNLSCPVTKPIREEISANQIRCCGANPGGSKNPNDCIILTEPIANPTHPGQSINLTPISEADKQALKTALQSSNNSCPQPIKDYFINIIDNNGDLYSQGTYILARDTNGNPVTLTCANANVLQKIVIRGIMVIFSLVGLVLAFAIIRAGIMMMTSFANSDQFENAVQSLFKAIMYTVGALFGYTFFVFLAVGVIGVGTNPTKPEYNLFCQNRIIFNLTFDQAEAC